MYKQFFGLQANPFNVSPDPRYLLLTPPAEEALACLTYGIQTRRGFILLTGEVGTGKTTLIHKLLDWLRAQGVPTAYSFNSLLDSSQLLQFILADLGLSPTQGDSKTRILLELYNFLLERFRAGRTTVLIIDEAQSLSQELLEEIRLLTNFETATEKLLQVVLVGQPELEAKIKQPELRALRQRIALRAKLYPFTLDETGQYIARRLQVAGANGNTIFDPTAVEAVYRHSEGIPRVINVLCEHALVSAFADQQKTISADIIESIAVDFGVDSYASSAKENGKRAPKQDATELVEALKGLAALADHLNGVLE
ncbi:MAG TPA: AAA family ATPase [Terriglobales bacterium]|nr:AAA family ATPase [Terriglobales bacterium]